MASGEILHLELKGLDKVNKALLEAPEMVREETGHFFDWAVTHLTSEVQDRTPTAEGHLRRSIIGRTEVSAAGMLGVVGTPLAYAVPVELGTKPHPVSEEGIMAIAAWVMHKIPLGQSVSLKTGRPLKNRGAEEAALGIAHAIAWKIRRVGSKGHFMFKKALDANESTLARRWSETVDRIVSRLGGAS